MPHVEAYRSSGCAAILGTFTRPDPEYEATVTGARAVLEALAGGR